MVLFSLIEVSVLVGDVVKWLWKLLLLIRWFSRRLVFVVERWGWVFMGIVCRWSFLYWL